MCLTAIVRICAGLGKDCPFQADTDGQDDVQLTTESVGSISDAAFAEYASRLYQYLQVRSRNLDPWHNPTLHV